VLESCGIAMLGLVALCFSATPGGVLAALPILGALGFGAVRILPLINTAYVGWSLFAGNRRAFSDVLRLLETPMVPEGAANAQIAFEREISFRQVSLRYPARGYALRDVSLRIPRGAWTALWGPTGSGKSSVLDLASGLIAPSAGIILIDDVPLDGTTQAAWQAMIAHVPQTVYLTDGSIGANIAFGVPEAQVDRARLRDAVERAQLAEFVASLPEGLDTWVGDAGIRLSGGQRQRIAIARALYRRSRLIILDEATGQLDRETEHMVIETLRNGVGEAVTVLVVTHNPAVLERCDHVIELHRGRVVGQAG
jgi:ABC-type multidrug transport system fused ATPase/permease subunit